jgi:hypothetical protein
MASQQERLEEFYRRLAASPPAGNVDEALELITTLLNAVGRTKRRSQ